MNYHGWTPRNPDSFPLWKTSGEQFEITKEYEEKLSNKINTYSEETGTKKSLLLTMITTYGVKQNTFSNIYFEIQNKEFKFVELLKEEYNENKTGSLQSAGNSGMLFIWILFV